MKKNIFAILFAVGCSLASVEVSSFSSGSLNQSIPNIQLKNSGEEIVGFKIYYYFSAADSKNISIESYYLAGGSAKLEKLSENQYRVEFDFSDTVLGREERFPNDGYLQFGLHYSDWSLWNKEDDFSHINDSTISLNHKIIVQSSSGNVLAGVFPNKNELVLEPCVVKIYSKSQSENNYGRYRVYAKNEGKLPVTHFNFDVEISVENGKTPLVDEWYLPNVSQNLERNDSNVWILHFYVQNINLEAGEVYPNESGFSFGIRYEDFSRFDISNDYSLRDVENEFEVNDKIPVYIDGNLIFGNPKIRDLTDIKEIISSKNGYSLSEFNMDINSLIDTTFDFFMTWDELGNLKETLFDGIPDFDTTAVAFFQILKEFPGLDTLFLSQNYKEIKSIYERLVTLRMIEYIEHRSMVKKKKLLGAYDKYNELNKYETWLLASNPLKIPGSVRAYNRAKQWTSEYAKKWMNGIEYNNRADGFRHSVWNALLCRETGTQYDDISDCLKWAKDFTNAHEKTSEDNMEKSMDLHNNKIGRDAYAPTLKVGCEWDWGFACVNEEVVGLSREETKEMYENLANTGVAFNEEEQLGKSPWIRAIVFLRDDKGNYYCSADRTENCVKFEEPAIMASKIAVLKKDIGSTCEEEFSFRLDLEDEDNGSKIVSGDPNPPGIIVGSGGIVFTYCVLNMDNFYNQIPRVPYDYIVLRMDRDCPAGTYAFSRHHDTEDSDNANFSEGNLGPNVVTKNATLEYCFVPADKNSTLEYPFDKSYGVFANYSSIHVIHSQIFIDDEDSDNANSWNWYDTPADMKERIKKIMNGSSNTIYYVVQWIEIVWTKVMNWIGG